MIKFFIRWHLRITVWELRYFIYLGIAEVFYECIYKEIDTSWIAYKFMDKISVRKFDHDLT